MDERIFQFKAGHPIPEWDLKHRLPINNPVGPECQDTSTVFRINSTFMDITDQPYRERQWLAGGVLVSCLGVVGGMWSYYLTRVLYPDAGGILGDLYCLAITILFGYLAFRHGRDEFFSLKRRPIRFNRKEKKLYAIRRRRFFAKPGQGDITWEVPWDENAIFCIHRGYSNHRNTYHIRHYEVDKEGNVIRAFAVGRKWEGQECLDGLLSQWNYWCWYMNRGPEELPKPLLFFKEKENMLESFLFCMYDLGMRASAAYRISMMPFILLLTSHRLMALWTCCDPVWPEYVKKVSVIAPDDPYDEPRGKTPVGWAETTHALNRREYPDGDKKAMENWRGEKDPVANALLWAAEIPPDLMKHG
ncbi:hypothetical protein G5B88_19285 [Herbaspirillum seropedicae]|uniref:DUF6708 domain-containing protein n=1 Tax=Herbaspirillum seropedicae TaxID=964 RepID=UPI00059BB74A|nr:DUF6708 domain-containing protein [Herbaspirillum seropedicae]AKN67137.1 hypothetical protein ACP92_19010 [Herbaspirillum seropedicae]NQE30261.1 hypothetical protein [Herbaspirillum seropedicae]UMU23144.1 hypothetical protein G5B88_19285 [Herbaspirillum seropedicae]